MKKYGFDLKKRVAGVLAFTLVFNTFSLPAYAEPIEIEAVSEYDTAAEEDILTPPFASPEAAEGIQNDLLDDMEISDEVKSTTVKEKKEAVEEENITPDGDGTPGGTLTNVSYIDENGKTTTT